MKYTCKIALVADLTVDRYVDSGAVRFGGAALNSSMWAKRMRMKPFMVSAVGSDQTGKEFLRFIRKQNLSIIGIQKKRGATSAIEIFIRDGERHYGKWKPGVLGAFHVRKKDKKLLETCDAVVAFAYPQFEHVLAELPEKPFAVINFGDLKEFHDDLGVVERFAPAADILLFGLDKDRDEALINRIRGFATPTRMCLVTLGKYGSVAWMGDKTFVQSAKEIDTVDTTGAGDAFLVGFLKEYLASGDIQTSLAKGTALASRAIQKIGAY